jgi:hypothetical protein
VKNLATLVGLAPEAGSEKNSVLELAKPDLPKIIHMRKLSKMLQ